MVTNGVIGLHHRVSTEERACQVQCHTDTPTS